MIMKVLKSLEFRNGFNYVENSQIIFRPLPEYLVLHNYIVKKYPKEKVFEIFKQATIEDSSIHFKNIKNKIVENETKDSEVIKMILEYISLIGFGEIKLNYLFSDKILFSLTKNFASKSYRNTYSEYPEVLIESISGAYLENMLSIFYKKKINVETIMKQDEVSFVAKFTDEDFEFVSKYSYPEKESNEDLKPYLKSIIHKNLIQKNQGIITMVGIEVYIEPYLFFLKLTELIYDKEYEKFAVDFGSVIGKLEFSWVKPVGEIDKKSFLNSMVDFHQVNGYGNIEYSEDFKGFKFLNNFDWYRKYFDDKIINIEIFRQFNVTKRFLEYFLDISCDMEVKDNCAKLIYTDNKPNLTDVQEEMYKQVSRSVILDRNKVEKY